MMDNLLIFLFIAAGMLAVATVIAWVQEIVESWRGDDR